MALPASLRQDLADWKNVQRVRSDNEFIFPNAKRGVFRLGNYRADILRPALKRITEEPAISGIEFRTCRRTCATHLSQHLGVKEVQTYLLHSRATTALEVYIQEIQDHAREAVERLGAVLAVARPSRGEEKLLILPVICKQLKRVQ